MRILKLFLMLVALVCMCFLLFTMSTIFSANNRVVWYRYVVGLSAFMVVVFTFVYHLRSLRFYKKESLLKNFQKFPKMLLVAPLLFSGFFLWLVSEVILFLVMEAGNLYRHYIFDAFVGVVFMLIAAAGIIELTMFYKKLKTGEIKIDEINDIGTPDV